jgi:hypothetical protein
VRLFEGRLATFAFPLSVEEFKQEIYRKKCLAVVGGAPSRFGAIGEEHFCDLSLPKLLEITASERIFCWFKVRRGACCPLRGPPAPCTCPFPRMVTHGQHSACVQLRDGSISSVEVDTPEAALTAHAAGASLYFRSSQEAADVLVGAMSRDVGLSFAALQVGWGNRRHPTCRHSDPCLFPDPCSCVACACMAAT